MRKVIIALMLTGPMLAFAAPLSGVTDVVGSLGTVVGSLIPILMSLAVVVFFWGLVKYIANASDEAAKEGGKTLMIWGMVAIFVMVALWGIIGFFGSMFGIGAGGTIPIPGVPSPNR